MLRVVLDPGLLIAALISPRGVPAQLIREWLDGAFELVVSPDLLVELRTVLARPKVRSYVSEDQVAEYLALLRRLAIVKSDPKFEPGLTPDPGDDYLVALARASDVDYLVASDPHLTGLGSTAPPIHGPRQFLGLLEEQGPK